MDAQKQERLNRIFDSFYSDEEYFESGEDVGFLLKLVHDQETQLAKYERVVEAAKNLVQTMKIKVWDISRERELVNAVDALECQK